MQEEITHMQQVFLSRENILLKTLMPASINQMNKYVLQLLHSIELTLQVQNLSLYSQKASDPDLVIFFFGLSSYLLELFLEELVPIIYEIPLIELRNSLGWSYDYMQQMYTQD